MVYFVVAEAGAVVVCFAAAAPVVVVVLVVNGHSGRGTFQVAGEQAADNSAVSYSGSAVVAEADMGAAVAVEVVFAVVFVVVVVVEWVVVHSASFVLVRPRALEREVLAEVGVVAVVLVTVVGVVAVVAEQAYFEQIHP